MFRAAVFSACLSLVCSGCSLFQGVQCDFVDAISASDAVIIPHYKAYIEEDPRLSDEEKADILQHLGDRQRLVQRESEECE